MSPAVQTRAAMGRPLVVALHCSGGTPEQWQALAHRLGPGCHVFAPSLYGAPGGPIWQGTRPFFLASEAPPILAAIDAHSGPVHIVGHSYGGALALHIAARRAARITSLAVYEPSAFHLLEHFGPGGRKALREVTAMVEAVRLNYARGTWRQAAAIFVDYWNGKGAWERMPPELQAGMVRYLPKSQLDFHALTKEGPAGSYAGFEFPMRLLCGERAPFPTRLIAEQLAARLPDADMVAVGGAGHMGPITHAAPVANAIAGHIWLAGVATGARAA